MTAMNHRSLWHFLCGPAARAGKDIAPAGRERLFGQARRGEMVVPDVLEAGGK
jgi:hypothetical protein